MSGKCFYKGDLDLHGRDPNVVRDTSSQHGGHFCKKKLKSDYK